mgnify:CR=1 FL=1
MDTQPEQIGRELSLEEEREYREGRDLEDLTKMPGWNVLYKLWDRVASNAGVDPRGMKEDEWKLASLAAWAAANNAKEFLQEVQRMIDRSETLDKIRTGEIRTRSLKI